ncbi:hypothetical protein RND71_023331 [Anisodus tanguticus]|uniref:Uncharacterized protein n=1 Tax=Anisodus tanguticus TaxID=243964 RepID=A0AAE1RTP8_9SOLA|nr:hypothetical protein RND71_023331 [Anisodus tanguticus]
MGSSGGIGYGAYACENLEREPYLPSEKLRILITRVGAFIASHIARRLKSEGHYIIASDWKKNEHMTEDMFCHEFHLVDLRIIDNCRKAEARNGETTSLVESTFQQHLADKASLHEHGQQVMHLDAEKEMMSQCVPLP